MGMEMKEGSGMCGGGRVFRRGHSGMLTLVILFQEGSFRNVDIGYSVSSLLKTLIWLVV
jgi:hypothetical protein